MNTVCDGYETQSLIVVQPMCRAQKYQIIKVKLLKTAGSLSMSKCAAFIQTTIDRRVLRQLQIALYFGILLCIHDVNMSNEFILKDCVKKSAR